MLIISLIFLQVFIFAALIFILRRILAQNVVSATKHLEELNQDYVKKEEEINRLLEEAKQKSQDMVAKAKEEAESLRTKIITEANKESDQMLNEARLKSTELIQQAERSRQLLLSEMEARIAEGAINKASELISNTLPEQFKIEVHAHWVDELIEGGFNQLKELRIDPDTKEVKITSAFRLSDSKRQTLSKKLRSALGHDVTLKEEVDPTIVAGIIITIGSLVLDGSLRNRIQEQARNAKRTISQ